MVLAALLVACAASQEPSTPEAAGTFTLHCNQSSLRWDACYQKAARLCGDRGYRVIREASSAVPIGTTDSLDVPAIGGAMVIRCNP